MSETVKIGLVGYGNMGKTHADNIKTIEGGKLVAVSDIAPEKLEIFNKEVRPDVDVFDNIDAMLDAGKIDAVFIATPHYFHPEMAIKALDKGMHVLIEKPAGVYTKHVKEMNAAAEKADKVFGIMFNQRSIPAHQKIKDLVESDELGEIKRTNWIITDWYRSQSYYNSGGWRATWKGEGGGVLLNQCPHQLDLWQWICGMPVKVRAYCSFGKYHDIEVEDDVTAYVEYENGATGVFISSTGEAPGSNRFEIAADNGKLVFENGNITFWRNRVSEREFNRTFTGGFGSPECWKCEIPVGGQNPEQHKTILQNWINAINTGSKLLAPGIEGLNSLLLSNAMLLSAWTDEMIELKNFDDDLFFSILQERIANSKVVKDPNQGKSLDTKGTY